MQIPDTLTWNLSPTDAMQEQARLALRVHGADELGVVRCVAGVDVGLEKDNTVARAAVVVLAFPSLEPITSAVARKKVKFPYIPGLLAYRELPALLAAFAMLEREPDLVIVDGHGLAHPRRFGIACHLGVLLDVPTIGCAKSILVGRAATPQNQVGAWTPLVDKGQVVGAALRTKLNTARVSNPVYVSIGHRVSLETALDFVLRCCRGYRVPETTRFAHRLAGGHAIG